jgi:hypothetical protein
MKRVILITILTLLIILIIGIFSSLKEANYIDKECVKVQTSCCPCNMGGEEKCVFKNDAEEYKINLTKCKSGTICRAVFNCEIESCQYIDGECIAT